MTIERDMNVACHPLGVRGGVFTWVCDNWLTGADGPGERLHAFPQGVVEAGSGSSHRGRSKLEQQIRGAM